MLVAWYGLLCLIFCQYKICIPSGVCGVSGEMCVMCGVCDVWCESGEMCVMCGVCGV